LGEFSSANAEVEKFERQMPRGIEPYHSALIHLGMIAAGLRHLALAVSDFAGTYARLKEKGVHFLTEAQTTHGNSLAFFTDPDGNILHLLHRETPLP